jgi:hypothetical protein
MPRSSGSDDDEASVRLEMPPVGAEAPLETLPEPDTAEPLGAAVDGLLPGAGAVAAEGFVVGEALGVALFRAAWACWLQRSKSVCVSVGVCP